MKVLKWAVVPAALAILLVLPGAALAQGNTSDVEQKWVDFQKAVTDRMVQEGRLTRQDADARVKDLQTKFAASAEDSIYEFFAKKLQSGGAPEGKCRDGRCNDRRDGAANRVYAMMTRRNAEELKRACEAAGTTVWELARKEGKLQQLKDRLLAAHSAGYDAMVKNGVMSEEQRGKAIDRLKDELGKQ